MELHAHDSSSFMAEFGELLSSPAHWAFELLFSVLFDLIVISLFYGILVKKVIIPRLKRTLHEEIDKEHGVPAHD
jgi:nucleoside permease NupC